MSFVTTVLDIEFDLERERETEIDKNSVIERIVLPTLSAVTADPVVSSGIL